MLLKKGGIRPDLRCIQCHVVKLLLLLSTLINSRNEIRPCSLWTVCDLQLCICCCQLSCTLAPPLKLMSPSAVTKRDREYLREESIYYAHTRYSQNWWTNSICRPLWTEDKSEKFQFFADVIPCLPIRIHIVGFCAISSEIHASFFHFRRDDDRRDASNDQQISGIPSQTPNWGTERLGGQTADRSGTHLKTKGVKSSILRATNRI